MVCDGIVRNMQSSHVHTLCFKCNRKFRICVGVVADMGAALRRAAGGKVRRVWFQPPKSGVTKFDLGESSV